MTSLAVPVGCERSLLPRWGFSPQGRAAVGSVGNVPGVSTAGLQPGEHVLRKLQKDLGFFLSLKCLFVWFFLDKLLTSSILIWGAAQEGHGLF